MYVYLSTPLLSLSTRRRNVFKLSFNLRPQVVGKQCQHIGQAQLCRAIRTQMTTSTFTWSKSMSITSEDGSAGRPWGTKDNQNVRGVSHLKKYTGSGWRSKENHTNEVTHTQTHFWASKHTCRRTSELEKKQVVSKRHDIGVLSMGTIRLVLSGKMIDCTCKRWMWQKMLCSGGSTARVVIDGTSLEPVHFFAIGGGGRRGRRGTFWPKHGFLKIKKFNSRPVKERKKKHKKEEKKTEKNARRVRNGTCPRRTISGPNSSNLTTEIRLFWPLDLANFRALLGRQKSRKKTEKKWQIEKHFAKKWQFFCWKNNRENDKW